MDHMQRLNEQLATLPAEEAEACAADLLDFLAARKTRLAREQVARWRAELIEDDEALSPEEQAALDELDASDVDRSIPGGEVFAKAKA